MKGRTLIALAFYSIAGVAGACSRAASKAGLLFDLADLERRLKKARRDFDEREVARIRIDLAARELEREI